MALHISAGTPVFAEMSTTALTSFGKQLPPYPSPGNRNDVPSLLGDSRFDAAHVDRSVGRGGAAGGDEHDIHADHHLGDEIGKMQAAVLLIARPQLVKPGLEMGKPPFAQQGYFPGVLVGDDDVIAHFRQADPGNQPHISRPHNADLHDAALP